MPTEAKTSGTGRRGVIRIDKNLHAYVFHGGSVEVKIGRAYRSSFTVMEHACSVPLSYCPFCGDVGTIDHIHGTCFNVRCTSCGAEGPYCGDASPDAEQLQKQAFTDQAARACLDAVLAWNRRHKPLLLGYTSP